MTDFDPGALLGPRLRQIRQARGLSARELARRISCSPSLISQIERGLSAPSVGVLYALATELQTSLDFLFSANELRHPGPGTAAPAAAAAGVTGAAGTALVTAHGDGRLRAEGETGSVVQRRAGRRTIDLASGVRWERLTPGPDDRVDFLEVTYEPGGHSTDMRRPLRHDGREYGVVVTGVVRARVGVEEYELGPGDSIAFDSSLPHQYWNPGSQAARAVWVVVHARPGRA